jgi:hypothetical protein
LELKEINPKGLTDGLEISKIEIDYQEHFEFIKTEQGYKLLSVSIKGDNK